MEKSAWYIKLIKQLLLLLTFFYIQSCEQTPKENTSPNVLMISIDDLNDWIGVLGVHPDIKTPHLDRLANEGILFTNAHCQAPICGPSRASLLSGLRPSTSGVYGQIKDKNLRSVSALKEIDFLPQYFGPVELLDIYPTLIDLTQLPKNPLNEGRSLLPLMQGSNIDRALAITTYGRDNHSLINQTHRYIHYEDGSEELYDLRIDPDERNNLADRIDSGPIKQAMMNRIPKLNVPWSAHSYNTVNEYFKRTSNSK